MSRIKEAFAGGKAFIPFITCGDPDLDTTKEIVRAMEKNGADLIELGIPFSDPTAEGPVIQAANLRALTGGVTTDKIFDMVEDLRKDVKVPMVFMTYANVVFSYGIERFAKKAATVGMDGVILLAFFLGFPANEIVMPCILMGYLSAGTLVDCGSLPQLRAVLTANGWTAATAVSVLLFTLFHFPCGTTCLTIWRDTRSLRWTALAVALPLAVGVALCGAVHLLSGLLPL